jgi:hypothetical protein
VPIQQAPPPPPPPPPMAPPVQPCECLQGILLGFHWLKLGFTVVHLETENYGRTSIISSKFLEFHIFECSKSIHSYANSLEIIYFGFEFG